jgi:3-dehydroquinate synthase
MQTIKLNLKERSYNIIVGTNIINGLGKYLTKLNIGNDAYVITNARIKNKYGGTLEKALKKRGFSVRFKILPDTEKSKSIEMMTSVIRDTAHYDKGKRIFIVAFGGGVVGDLSGFVASIYKRGIPYIQVPTTLLAQVDSSIGGKTAVDLSEAKNLVGAFYQPKLVFSDVKFLNSLSMRQMRAGLAEVIKYSIIKDRILFSYLERQYKNILNHRQDALKFIVERCSRIKADIVSRDEREKKGLRTILNFGHTAGHAIEAASNYKAYNHGEAIALGMLVAIQLSKTLKLINEAVTQRIENLIKAVGLPTRIRDVSLNSIINAHYRDKKFIGSRNRFVLIKGIGKTKIVENIPLELIKGVLKKRVSC